MPLWLLVITAILVLNILWCFLIYKNSSSSGVFEKAAIIIILIVTILVISGILAGKFLL